MVFRSRALGTSPGENQPPPEAAATPRSQTSVLQNRDSECPVPASLQLSALGTPQTTHDPVTESRVPLTGSHTRSSVAHSNKALGAATAPTPSAGGGEKVLTKNPSPWKTLLSSDPRGTRKGGGGEGKPADPRLHLAAPAPAPPCAGAENSRVMSDPASGPPEAAGDVCARAPVPQPAAPGPAARQEAGPLLTRPERPPPRSDAEPAPPGGAEAQMGSGAARRLLTALVAFLGRLRGLSRSLSRACSRLSGGSCLMLLFTSFSARGHEAAFLRRLFLPSPSPRSRSTQCTRVLPLPSTAQQQ